MPLMRPEIQAVLRASGLDKTTAPAEGPEGISDKLNRAGLSADSIADELSELARNSQNEGMRLRALETASKMHGLLKETTQVALPSFTIVIQQGASPASHNNDILFPRQSLNSASLNSTNAPKEN